MRKVKERNPYCVNYVISRAFYRIFFYYFIKFRQKLSHVSQILICFNVNQE